VGSQQPIHDSSAVAYCITQSSWLAWCVQDLETYNKAAVAIAKKYFAISDIDDYYKKKDARPLIFCHFARGLSDKTYDEVGGSTRCLA
jgi:hypothetical protein